MSQLLTVKSPRPARFPAYTIESAAGETLATVPITASGDSHKLALAMAAAPALLAFAEWFVGMCEERAKTLGCASPQAYNAKYLDARAAVDQAIKGAT